MRRNGHRLLVILALLVGAAPVVGQSTTWTGANDTSWGTAANWTNGVPGATTAAVIPGGTPNDPSTAGTAAVCSALTVQAGASLTVASGTPLEIAGGITAIGVVTGPGSVRLVGAGVHVISSSGGPLPDVVCDAAGTYDVGPGPVFGGDLTLLAGTLRPTSGGVRSVAGTTSFAGGTLSASNGIFDFDGPVIFSGTTAATPPNLIASSDWTSDATFTATSGTVTFDGVGTTIVASGSSFRSIIVPSGASVAVGTVALSANLTVDGVTTGGTLVLTGSGSVAGTGTISNLAVSASGTYTVFESASVSGDLLVSSGTLRPTNTAVLSVQGDAVFSGGEISALNGSFDLNGDVQFVGTIASTPPPMTVAGTWVSEASFNATSNTITFDGSSTQTIDAPGSVFANVVVAAGATIDPVSDMDVDGAMTVSGTVTDGTVRVEDGLVFNGTAAAGTTFVLDGMGIMSGSGTFPNVTVTAGVRDLSQVTIGGTLRLLGGTMRPTNGGFSTFAGPALFEGGVITTLNGTFRCEGPVTFSGTDASAPPFLTVTSDWTSDASFIPGNGTVTFDGSGTIQAASSRFAGVTFTASSSYAADTVPVGQTLVVEGDVTGTLRLEGGGTFTVLGDAILPNLVMAATGTRDLAHLTIGGDLTVLSGTLRPTSGAANTVVGTSLFSGGVFSPLNGIFDFDGPVTFSGTNVAAPPIMVVSSDWTSDASFAPSSSTVTFDGVGNVVAAGSSFNAVTVASSASLTVDTLVVRSTLVVSGAVAGTIRLEGIGTRTVTATATLPDLVMAATGTRDLAHVTIGGALTQLSGTLRPTSGGACTVLGPSLFGGGVLASLNGFFHFDGPVTFAGTTVIGPPNLTASSDWTSDAGFAPTSGSVTFDGTGTVSAAASSFCVVSVQATADLTVDELPVRSTLTVDGAIAGTVRLLGTGLVLGSAPLPDVIVDATGARDLSGVTVGGALTLLGGDLRPTSGLVTTFAGPSLLLGGTVSALNGFFDFDGDVTFGGTTVTSPPPITVAGSWSADAGFAPTSGTVTFDGAEPQSITGPLVEFNALAVSAASVVEASVPIHVRTTFDLDGLLATSSTLDLDGALLADPASVLLLGSGEHRFASTVTASGKLHASGTIVFDGAGVVTAGPASPFPDVLVDGTGTVVLSALRVTGDLDLVGGTLVIGGAPFVLLGDFLGSGGILSRISTSSVLDVAGDVTFAGTTSTTPPRIRCAGDWSADGGFDPTGLAVELDGAAGTTMTATAPDGILHFRQLEIRNGVRSITGDTTLDLTSAMIFAGGSLDVASHRLAIPAGPVAVDGEVAVGAGGELALGATASVTVNAAGIFRLVGSVPEPAAVRGEAGGGYSFTVNGALAASGFVFEDMGPSGIVVALSASLAPAPHDLRGGRFDRGSPTAGSVLLDIRRAAPTQFRNLTFENATGTATFNVRSPAGAGVSFVNFRGVFGGATFEDDPGDRIDWNADQGTELASFAATGGVESVQVDWVTSQEIGVLGFELARGSSTSGPWTPVASLPATGPSAYQVVDQVLTPDQVFVYRLTEVLTGGVTHDLGTVSASATAAAPSAIVDVGPGGFPDVQAALAAATGSSRVVRVAPGTYPSFAIGAFTGGHVRVVGDGTGPVFIDTALGPVTIADVGADASVELAGLAIGSPGSPNPGLLIQDADGAVILESLVVTGGGGQPGVAAVSAAALALQSCVVAGTPGFAGDDVTSQATRGTLATVDLANESTLVLAGLALPSGATDATSTLTPLLGVAPRLDVPPFVALGTSAQVDLAAGPVAPWALFLATAPSIFAAPGLELVGLLDPFTAILVGLGLTSAGGDAQVTLPLPAAAVTLIGESLALQTISFAPASGAYRWSNLANLAVTP